jgi:hypothetical protein
MNDAWPEGSTSTSTSVNCRVDVRYAAKDSSDVSNLATASPVLLSVVSVFIIFVLLLFAPSKNPVGSNLLIQHDQVSNQDVLWEPPFTFDALGALSVESIEWWESVELLIADHDCPPLTCSLPELCLAVWDQSAALTDETLPRMLAPEDGSVSAVRDMRLNC